MKRIFSWMVTLLWVVLSMPAANRVIRVQAGDVESLLQAIGQANEQNAEPTAPWLYVLIPAGTYDLGERTLTTVSGHHVALVGQGVERTIIKNKPPVEMESIRNTAVIQNRGNDNCFMDLTLRNDLDYYRAGAAGRAVCLQDKGTRTICKRVRMLSFQDTYYSDNEDCQHYMEDTEIHGTVDFICGAGDVWFEHCLIVTEKRTESGKGRNVIAAPRTSRTHWGYVFNRCTIRNDVSEFHYARGWHTTPHCYWLHTTLETPDRLKKPRFDPQGMRTVQSDFREFHTMDAEGNDITPASNPVTFTLKDEQNTVETIMSAQEARRFTLKNVFPDWQPRKTARRVEKRAGKQF